VTISGSSTVEPISGLVAEKFYADNSDVAISVQGPGTSDGLEQFCAGEIDIADASRAIEEEEITACEVGGVEYVELQIGIDGLSVITQG
jgi:phosphate transport system substrate-binding protein